MNNAILLASIIAGAGIIYDTIEFISGKRELLNQFYNWRIVRSRYYILLNRPALSLLFDFVFAERIFISLVVVHGISAAMFPFVFYLNVSLAAIPALIVLTVHCLMNVRILVGRDGADQMQSILWASVFAYCLPLHENVKLVVSGFVVAQLILSYLTSGLSKLISPVWRKGVAMNLITRMATYCPPQINTLFKNRSLSFVICWLTILFELLSPLLLFFGPTGAIVFIILGIFFHAGIAAGMGLTTFVFAFVATYPIVYEFSTKL